MKTRHVYAVRDRPQLEAALRGVRACGVADDDLAIVARHDIELAVDPDALHDEQGRLTGLIAGLNAVAVPVLGISIAGEDAEQDVRDQFAQRIERGEILLVVEAAPEMRNAVNGVLVAEGAEELPL